MTDAAAPHARGPGLALGLFLISAAVLCLQVLHVRILSVQVWYHHAYVVVTMAMLGFAAAGSAATMFPALVSGRGDFRNRLAWCSVLFGASVVVTHVLVASTTDLVTSMSAEGNTAGIALICSLLVVPYLFGGLVVAISLSAARGVHGLYSANLVGSALGAWLFVIAITPLGAERLLVLCAGAGPAAALLFARSARLRAIAGGVGLILAAVLFLGDFDLLRVRLGEAKKRLIEGTSVDERWTPLSRLDVLADNLDAPTKYFIVQDGMAGTYMFGKDQSQQRSLHDARSVSYLPHVPAITRGEPGPHALIIGLGGGQDIQSALDYKASTVTGFEINEQMVAITGEDYADFNGGIYQREGVDIVVGEGRSTLRREGRRFDLIQIAGADTYTAGAGGAFVLSESYLYTMEALKDYFDHLSERGVLGIVRLWDKPHKEVLRMFGMGLAELRRRGVEQPSRHAAIIRSSWLGGTVFTMQPLEPDVIELFDRTETDAGWDAEFELLYAPGLEDRADTPFTQLAMAYDRGEEEAFFAGYPLDVRPIYDDSPFFYNFQPQVDAAELPVSFFAEQTGFEFPSAPEILNTLLLLTAAAVLLLVLGPLLVLRFRGLRSPGALPNLLYFAALGVGFMFLEISTIQRMVLYLGHPTYSLMVVLFSFLFFAGLGSLWSGRLTQPVRALRVALGAVCVVILLMAFLLQPVLAATLHLSFWPRVGVAVALLAPLSFCLGIPFPSGLARLERSTPSLVPWAVGVNGGAGVVGSVAAVVIAMRLGFTADAFVAAGCYAVALVVAVLGMARR
ncbi:MAG: hypothetical protein AAF628_28780 [Planctomycetota bacterium]